MRDFIEAVQMHQRRFALGEIRARLFPKGPASIFVVRVRATVADAPQVVPSAPGQEMLGGDRTRPRDMRCHVPQGATGFPKSLQIALVVHSEELGSPVPANQFMRIDHLHASGGN